MGKQCMNDYTNDIFFFSEYCENTWSSCHLHLQTVLVVLLENALVDYKCTRFKSEPKSQNVH